MILSLKHLKFSIVLVLLLGVFFKANSKELKLSFEPVFLGTAFSLNQTYVTTEGDSIQISLCKMYLANFQLNYKNGSIYIEPNSFHLLDLEYDSTLSLKLKDIPRGEIESISFTLGIDSATSCSGAMPGDLDPMHGMYWAWNSGYINAKMEGRSPSCETRNNEFQFHIGGYKSKVATIQEVGFDLPKIKKNTINFTMDLNAWFEKLDLSIDNSVLVPGKEAVQMAKRYGAMFSID